MSEILIGKAEGKWLPLIIPYTEKIFTGHWMPSHDLEHHRRVWKNACDILVQIKETNPIVYEELILACFFHDLGLLFDPSDRHGAKSSSLCKEFLNRHPDRISFIPERLLEAIEHHDDKEYTIRLDHNPVYRFLSIADDYDAFGALGVYRYIEIYLLRGNETAEIPRLILKNAAGRYQKIISLIDTLQIDPLPYIKKYATLRNLLDSNQFTGSPARLVVWLQHQVIEKRKDPYAFFQSPSDVQWSDQRIVSFIRQWEEEIDAKKPD